ncbi:hypothetical protein DOM21_00960 [Bacteriovorax stolpii]|uniref:hypothetical protein n=1 Tax=Bacteriovorax stolpii TaxID=960 RepID=UPI00115A01AE|nr:hypothetical protein [Bacteriovorax stolpii]QDK40048.1 hypothetical protein DOM21_00960 [Bacteriovorax stolpii]
MLKVILFSILSFSVSAVEITVGVPPAYKKLTNHQEDKIKIKFEYDRFSLRTMNRTIGGELSMSILSPQNTIQSMWYGEILVKRVIDDFYAYILFSPKLGKIDKEKLENKTIGVIPNSTNEYFLKKYLGKIQYRKMAVNSRDLEVLINSGFVLNGQSVDAVVVDPELYNQYKKLSSIKFNAGFYFLVLGAKSETFVSEPAFINALKKNGIRPRNITPLDFGAVKELNESLLKDKKDREQFEVNFQQMTKLYASEGSK